MTLLKNYLSIFYPIMSLGFSLLAPKDTTAIPPGKCHLVLGVFFYYELKKMSRHIKNLQFKKIFGCSQ